MKNNTPEDKLIELIKDCKTCKELFRKLGYTKRISDHTRDRWYKIYTDIGINVPEYIKENNKRIYICKQCGKQFTEKYSKWSNGDFCSLSCAHKYSQTFIDKEKLSKTMKELIKNKLIISPFLLTPEQEKRRLKSFNDTIKNRLLNKPWEELSEELVKKRLFYEQEGKCNKCGLSEWLGKPISLELEHKDGNHYNNNRKNVELLCPNCHAQTDTYRGKNVNNAGKRYADEKLIEAFIKEGTLWKALKSLGLSPKGKNYERIIRVLIKYGFDIEKVKGKYIIKGV